MEYQYEHGTPERQEQLSDLELVACLLFELIDGEDEAVLLGSGVEVPLVDVAVLMCDLAQHIARGESLGEASKEIIAQMQVDHAVYRASRSN